MILTVNSLPQSVPAVLTSSRTRCMFTSRSRDSPLCESNSPMASPLVCVLKGKGGCDGVRPAIDYRHVNQFSVSDVFPIQNIKDVIQRIGGNDTSAVLTVVRAITKQRWGNQTSGWLHLCVLVDCSNISVPRSVCEMLGNPLAMQVILRPLREFADSYVDDCSAFKHLAFPLVTH